MEIEKRFRECFFAAVIEIQISINVTGRYFGIVSDSRWQSFERTKSRKGVREISKSEVTESWRMVF
jgi:hypothetical protein